MKIPNSMKLLIAISFVGLCLTACGCTAQEASPAESQAADSAMGRQGAAPDGMPADARNRTAPPEGMGEPGNRTGGPDFAAAAATLGVTEDELASALGGMEGGRTELTSAASALGVTVEELEEALGFSNMPSGGPIPTEP